MKTKKKEEIDRERNKIAMFLDVLDWGDDLTESNQIQFNYGPI